jgi:hypothetical protein
MLNKILIFKNKLNNFLPFRMDILSQLYKNETKVLLIEDNLSGIIIHNIVGTKVIRYSVLCDNEKICRVIDHNYLKVLK